MKIIELFENARADLYHGTLLDKAENIISADIMKAQMPVRSTDIPQQVKGHTATVSFSRSKNAAIRYSWDTQGWPGAVPTLLIINQDRLKQQVGNRLQPYDDVPTAAYNASYTRWNNGNNVPKTHYRKDLEEVVFGDIKGINRCITQIIIMPGGRDTKCNLSISRSPLLKDNRTVIQYDGKIYSPQEYLDFIASPDYVSSN